jgi:hypothetical protein
MRPGLPKRLPFWLGLALLASLAAERLAVLAKAGATDFDDAYTYVRYAAHLLGGEGVAWNPGEGPVYGTTSLLHLAVVTALRGLFPALSPASVLAAASGGAAIGLLAALVALLALGARHPRLHGNWLFWTAVVLPLVAYPEAFVFHAGTGMDTLLAALANAFLVFATLRLCESPRWATAFGVAAAAVLAVLARPDNALVALGCPMLALAFHRPRGKLLWATAAILVGSLGLLALIEWVALGSPVPLSFFAKQPGYYGAFAGEYAWNPFLFLKVFGVSAGPFVVVLVLFTDRAGARRAAMLLVPALASIALLFRWNQIMGHLGRFYYPFLPFFVAAAGLAFDDWRQRPQGIRPRAVLARAGVALLLVVLGNLGLSAAGAAYAARAAAEPQAPPMAIPARDPLPDLDSWQAAQAIAAIAAAAPPGARFAMSEHGLPGALAPQVTIIDVLGLHDRDFARHGFSAEALFLRRPDLIWLPHEDHRQMLRDLFASEEFWDHYDIYPDAFFHGLALRKDGPWHDRLAALVAAEWGKHYPGRVMADYQAVRSDRVGRE